MFWLLLSFGLVAAVLTALLLYRMVKKTSLLCTIGIIFVVLGFTLAGILWGVKLKPLAAPAEKIFNVRARQFAYEPPIIRVNKGDTVVLRLSSEDVLHGFYLDGYGIDVEVKTHGHGEEAEEGHEDDEPHGHGEETGEAEEHKEDKPHDSKEEAVEEHEDKEDEPHGHGEEAEEAEETEGHEEDTPPGNAEEAHDSEEGESGEQGKEVTGGHEESEPHGHEEGEEAVTEVRFLADKAGRFIFRCSIPCGSLHPFMVGKLIVRPNYLYSGSIGLAIGLTIATLIYLLTRKEESNERKI